MASTGQRVSEHGLSGVWHRWTRSQAQEEAAELQRRVQEESGDAVTAIDCCTPGRSVSISGVVRSMTIRPRTTVPALEIDLYDGSGSVAVVWLGRRRIPGIEAGRSIVVHGRLTCTTANPIIYNPKYELKPSAG